MVTIAKLTKEDIKRQKKKEYIVWGVYLVVIILLSISLRVFVYTNYSIVGDSMHPTYKDNDVVFATKVSKIERYDIIVFENNTGDVVIKRVIGFGGENIVYKDNQLYIEDELMDEAYKENLGTFSNTKDFNTFMLYRGAVPDGCYFVMGDNRGNSVDSRFKEMGCIPEEKVLGEVKMKIWGKGW